MTVTEFLRAKPVTFAALLVTAATHAAAAIAFAAGVHNLFDYVTGQEVAGIEPILRPALVTTTAILLFFITTVLQRRLSDGIGLAYAHTVRLRLFRHLLKSSPVNGKRRTSPLLPFVGDLNAVRQWVGDGIVRLILGSIISSLLICYVATRHPTLAITFAGTMAVLSLAAVLIRGPLDKATRTVRKSRGQLSTFVAGRLDAVATAETMGRSRSETRKLSRRSLKLYKSSIKRSWLVGILHGFTQASSPLLLVLVLMIGAFNVRGGAMSAGELLGLMTLVSVMGQALHDMGRALELFVPGHVAIQRIERIMAQPPRAPFRRSAIKVNAIGLSIDNLLVPGLCEPISMFVAPGEVVLLDGISGTGKSALLSTLGRIATPSTGNVHIDGIDVAMLKPNERQRMLGLASSAVPLLPGTIGMNLAYRRPKTTRAELLTLTNKLGLSRDKFDLDRMLNDPRFELSTGEYESLLVGRALLGEPQLLLLDMVDTRLPTHVLNELSKEISRYQGVILMAAQSHQLRATATRIWRFANGKIDDQPNGVSSNITALHTLESRSQ